MKGPKKSRPRRFKGGMGGATPANSSVAPGLGIRSAVICFNVSSVVAGNDSKALGRRIPGDWVVENTDGVIRFFLLSFGFVGPSFS